MGNTQMTLDFIDVTCSVHITQYAERPELKAIILIDEQEGLPVAHATVNLPSVKPLSPDHVFIKSWGVNAGMYDLLLEHSVILPVERMHPTGFVEAYECKLNTEHIKEKTT